MILLPFFEIPAGSDFEKKWPRVLRPGVEDFMPKVT